MREPLPRGAAASLSLVLGVVLHVDWHMARPLHDPRSLDWSLHWAITAAVFALAGCLIARRWPRQRWRLGAVVFVAAVVLAQIVEPVLELMIYEDRFGYDVEPARWMAFLKSIVAGGIAYSWALWLCTPRRSAHVT